MYKSERNTKELINLQGIYSIEKDFSSLEKKYLNKKNVEIHHEDSVFFASLLFVHERKINNMVHGKDELIKEIIETKSRFIMNDTFFEELEYFKLLLNSIIENDIHYLDYYVTLEEFIKHGKSPFMIFQNAIKDALRKLKIEFIF